MEGQQNGTKNNIINIWTKGVSEGLVEKIINKTINIKTNQNCCGELGEAGLLYVFYSKNVKN